MFILHPRLRRSMKGALDRVEAALIRARGALERPLVYFGAAALLVLLAFLVRLSIAAEATDVCCGHPDSWVYFHQAYVEYGKGELAPDAHRGSGWQLLLFSTLSLLGVAPGTAWTPYMTPFTGDAARAALIAHTLSAALSVGAVVATLLLAREVLSRGGAFLAAALVALDPFLLRNSTSAMSEPLFVPLFVMATMTVLRARRHPAWLIATGALMALASMLRVNGLLMFAALALFGLILLRTPARAVVPTDGRSRSQKWWRLVWGDSSPQRRRELTLWAFASVAVFFLVLSPYLVWREVGGAGAFDYGTNQRFWADELWDLQDPWWAAEFSGERIDRETLADYAARHSWSDAARRLYQSVAWQIYDLVGSGRYPPFELEGGRWVGSPQEESALTPLLFGLALVAAFTTMRSRAWLFLPIALVFTMATFVWIYPLVRSVRYFAPLIPLFVIAAVAGWQHLAKHVRRPRLVGAAVFGAYFALYGTSPLLHVGGGFRLLAESADARAIVFTLGALWLLVVLAPAVAVWRARPIEESNADNSG